MSSDDNGQGGMAGSALGRITAALQPLSAMPVAPPWNHAELADLLPATPLREAAVLVGLVDRDDGPYMLFTRRTDHLRHHAGQVSFPGGALEPEDVDAVAAALRDAGCYEISLGDTIGQGRPETIDAMLAAVLGELPADRLAGHYHDTAGRALDNIDASLARGLRVFDAAVGGLGGCPYAPGAKGNVATEKVAAHLERLGHPTGLDMGVVAEAAGYARGLRA